MLTMLLLPLPVVPSVRGPESGAVIGGLDGDLYNDTEMMNSYLIMRHDTPEKVVLLP